MFEKEIILKEQLAARCLESFWEFSCCSKNSCHFNQLVEPCTHAKTSNDDFANFRFISLRHNTSRMRELDQLLDGRKDSRDGKTCIMLRIFGNVLVDSVKIAQRLWRP